MRIKITYTVDGKPASSLEDAFDKIAKDGMAEIVLKALEPFNDEVNACGGSVVLDFKSDDYTMHITLRDMPDELSSRIHQALA